MQSDPNPKSCCVAGYGFIGAHLVDQLIADGHDVMVLDRKPRPQTLPQAVTWHQITFPDLTGMRQLLAGIDVVYFLVASTVPADTDVDLISELYQTVVGTIQFVETCKAAGVGKIVFASSASVYGNHGPYPVTETDPTNPVSAHGIQKLTLEKHLLMERQLDHIETQIFRIANPYGPGQSLTGRQGFIAIALGNLQSGSVTNIRGNGDAERDYIYITEVARGLASLGMQPNGPAIVNLGCGQAVSIVDLLALIQTISGQIPKVETLPASPHEIKYSCMDISCARSLGWVPRIGLEEGLRSTMAFHKII